MDGLTDMLNTPIERFTRRMFTEIIQALSAFLAGSNFTISEIAALHIISRAKGISVQSLGKKLNLSVSATSRVVSGLVKKRLLVSRKDTKDGRARIVTCSKAGQRLLDEMSLERVAAIAEVVKTLPPHIPKAILGAIATYEPEKE